MIVNNKFSKTIELLHSDNHYDVIYSKQRMDTMEFCKNFLNEVDSTINY